MWYISFQFRTSPRSYVIVEPGLWRKWDHLFPTSVSYFCPTWVKHHTSCHMWLKLLLILFLTLKNFLWLLQPYFLQHKNSYSTRKQGMTSDSVNVSWVIVYFYFHTTFFRQTNVPVFRDFLFSTLLAVERALGLLLFSWSAFRLTTARSLN